jgi:PEP-CTERM motif
VLWAILLLLTVMLLPVLPAHAVPFFVDTGEAWVQGFDGRGPLAGQSGEFDVLDAAGGAGWGLFAATSTGFAFGPTLTPGESTAVVAGGFGADFLPPYGILETIGCNNPDLPCSAIATVLLESERFTVPSLNDPSAYDPMHDIYGHIHVRATGFLEIDLPDGTQDRVTGPGGVSLLLTPDGDVWHINQATWILRGPQLDAVATPEPSTLLLLGTTGAILGARVWRGRRTGAASGGSGIAPCPPGTAREASEPEKGCHQMGRREAQARARARFRLGRLCRAVEPPRAQASIGQIVSAALVATVLTNIPATGALRT